MAQAVNLAKGSRFLVLAAVCIVVAALWLAAEVLVPLALAMLFCFLLAPLVTRLERWRLGRVPAVMIVVLGAVALVGGIGYVVVDQVLTLGKNLESYSGNIVSKVQSFRGGSSAISDIAESVGHVVDRAGQDPTTQPAETKPATLPTDIQGLIQYYAAQQRRPEKPPEVPPGSSTTRPAYTQEVPPKESYLQTIFANAGIILGPLGTAGLVIVFVAFMLLQREDLRDRLIRLTGKGQINLTTQALDDAGGRISRYLLAQTIVNVTYGAAIALGLYLIGRFFGRDDAGKYVPFPSVVVWGLLCAVLRFIPYIGPWLAAAFPIALSFAVYPNAAPFIATLAMFVVIELLSNNIMEPWLYGSSTGMSTVAILVAAVFWTWLWGAVGLLLSTPLTVILVVMGKYVPQLRFLDIMLGDEPVMDPHQRLYQRLIASDQEEATELAVKYAKERPLEEVFGEILAPALGMAEQDRHSGRLDEDRQAFIHQAMRDIVDEVWDVQQAADRTKATDELKQAAADTAETARTGVQPAPADPVAAVAGNGTAKPAGPTFLQRLTGKGAKSAKTPKTETVAAAAAAAPFVRPVLPAGCAVNIVILPAHDDADDIAGVMFSHLLALRGYCVFPMSITSLASEMVEEVGTRHADLVIVSAMPPAAVAHSRYLCKRLHLRFPDVNMIVGLWTSKMDVKKVRDRLTCEQSVAVVTTFAQALEQVHQSAQSVIVTNAANASGS